MLANNDDNSQKRSTKGINRETEIKINDFHNALYHQADLKSTQPRFNYNKQKSQMTLITQTKPALNSNLTKLRVGDDLITVNPLTQNNEYL